MSSIHLIFLQYSINDFSTTNSLSQSYFKPSIDSKRNLQNAVDFWPRILPACLWKAANDWLNMTYFVFVSCWLKRVLFSLYFSFLFTVLKWISFQRFWCSLGPLYSLFLIFSSDYERTHGLVPLEECDSGFVSPESHENQIKEVMLQSHR